MCRLYCIYVVFFYSVVSPASYFHVVSRLFGRFSFLVCQPYYMLLYIPEKCVASPPPPVNKYTHSISIKKNICRYNDLFHCFCTIQDTHTHTLATHTYFGMLYHVPYQMMMMIYMNIYCYICADMEQWFTVYIFSMLYAECRRTQTIILVLCRPTKALVTKEWLRHPIHAIP
jgi:hypothetical protein